MLWLLRSSTAFRLLVKVQFFTIARERGKTVSTPELVNGFSPDDCATTSVPVLETLPINKQLTIRAALPGGNKSTAAPVTWVRLFRNTQFSIHTESWVWPRCSIEMPAPHGLVKLSITSTPMSLG